MSGVTVKVSGLDGFRRDLEQAEKEIISEGEKVVGKGCSNIKKDVQRRWRGLAHLPHLPRSITYDVKTQGSVIRGEVGADRNRLQGKLAWVAEYGSPTSSPHPALSPALDTERPTFEKYAAQLGEDLLT